MVVLAVVLWRMFVQRVQRSARQFVAWAPRAVRQWWQPADQPRWARPAFVALLVGTALLYLWGLGASGWANAFYSAAVQAGSVSWEAFFFGSFDAGNSITVDKTPASLWIMALSVRIFGLSSWSILVPEALEGVAAVGVLYLAVRRFVTASEGGDRSGSGQVAGLLAGAVLALTPVAVLMFRFNNPDALLVLLLVAAAYACLRAVETASTRWLAFAGVLVGFGFLTKMLQALLVLPVFAIVYLVAAPTPLRRRIVQVLVAGAALVVSAGWWVAIVELTPASARPFIGGSQSNSILELALGYNGLGRLTGDEVGSVGGGGFGGGGLGGGGFGGGGGWGETGLTRLFNAENGGQIAWLLPAALILLVAGLWATRQAPRTDTVRAGLLVWGGWLLVTGLTFSLMAGIFHAYYNVALAPAIGALVGTGSVLLWQRRDTVGTSVIAGTIAVTALWSGVLLDRSPDWQPWLRPVVLVVGLLAAAGLVVSVRRSLPRIALTAVLAAGVGAGLAGPAAYAFETAATPHTGSIPTAGPSGQGRFGFGGPGGGRGGPGGFGGGNPGALAGAPPGAGNGFSDGTGGGSGPGGFPGGAGMPGGFPGGSGTGDDGRPGFGGGGGMGGLLDAYAPDAELVALLTTDADAYTWIAATVGSNNAAGLQLSTQRAVMPIGGFNGSDPSPTLEQFQAYVAAGRVHYFIGGGGFQSNGGSDAGSQIATWVAQTFTATTVGGMTVYDLTTPTAA